MIKSNLPCFKNWWYIILLCCNASLFAQPILLEEAIQANGVTCFPIYKQANTYRFLSNDGQLSTNDSKLPEFSLLRYSLERAVDPEDVNTITDTDGGGKLHFLATYSTEETAIIAAQNMIRERLKNDTILIKGPVAFESGRFYLISSIISGAEKGKNQFIGAGNAPIIENSKIARAFDLDQLQTSLLMQSLKLPTTDISMTFELTYTGISDYYEAEIEVDRNRLEKSELMGADVKVYIIGADIEKAFDKLIEQKIIRITEIGSNTSMEGLTHAVYEKLTKLLFEPVETSELPFEEKTKIENNIANSIGNQVKSVLPINLGVTYKRKNIQQSDTIRLSFKGRSAVERTHYITFNIGDQLYPFMEDERIFPPSVVIDEKRQRSININLDGETAEEFDQMINSVAVTLRKKHQNGKTTLKELLLNKDILKKATSPHKLSYLNLEDIDKTAWQNYEYQEHWQFIGGGKYTTPWKKSKSPSVILFAPFKRRSIDVLGDFESLMAKGVKAINVVLKYSFFGKEKEKALNIILDKNTLNQKMDITLPEGSADLNAVISYYGIKVPPVKLSGDISFLLLDLPTEEN